MHRRVGLSLIMVTLLSVPLAACGAGGGGDEASPGSGIAEALAKLPVPREVDADADMNCKRFGFTCSGDATAEQHDVALAAMKHVSDAMNGTDDPFEQIELALNELASMDGVANVMADVEGATMVEFTVDDGPSVG